MPIIWRSIMDEPQFFEKKGEAGKALREWRKANGFGRKEGEGPDKIVLRGRADIVALLNGVLPSGGVAAAEEDPHGLL